MTATPGPGATTVVATNQSGASTAATVPYHQYQEPGCRDVQLSSQDAPPAYNSATAFPHVVDVRYILFRLSVSVCNPCAV